MRAMVIGGNRHGEMVELLDGTKVWLDIVNATQHRIRKLTNSVIENATGAVTEVYVLHVAVHEGLTGPHEPQQVQMAMTTMAMNAFFREHGEKQEIPGEPPADMRPAVPVVGED